LRDPGQHQPRQPLVRAEPGTEPHHLRPRDRASHAADLRHRSLSLRPRHLRGLEAPGPDGPRLRAHRASHQASALNAGVLLGIALLAAAGAQAPVVVEDWTRSDLGAGGIPPGWKGENWGRASAEDLTVVEDEGRRALRMRSAGDRATLSIDL